LLAQHNGGQHEHEGLVGGDEPPQRKDLIHNGLTGAA